MCSLKSPSSLYAMKLKNKCILDCCYDNECSMFMVHKCSDFVFTFNTQRVIVMFETLVRHVIEFKRAVDAPACTWGRTLTAVSSNLPKPM